jgi:hypothetical protein
MRYWAGAALAVALLAGCTGNDRADKTADGMALAIKNAGASLVSPPAEFFAAANKTCEAFDDDNGTGYQRASAFANKPGEAPMRAAVAYLCPEHVAAWDATISVAKGG